ncbi:endothelin-converting enzyme, putative [Ixodes scapularis]|uniref:Endothelin-converting enzyme, putative n=1 Tax=Ixodes scapularis TaxID=6945 RepID=B7P9F7_IXOSC|nr:endothelin-converting enzyme, putative [Ixodes scapularis]|eukprot:XP_002404133.1 endothelin-converting enzyme, putative [Ixodes scapularis]
MERAQLFRDPCLDFDAFACGRFVQDHAAPDDHYFTNTLISMQDIIFVRLKKLLEDTSSSNRSTAVSKVKTLYNSCMNTSSVEHGSVALLRDLLRDEGGMGAWPALEEPEPLTLQSLGLERRLAVLRVHGVEPFFQLHVGQDEKNASMHVVQISHMGDYEGGGGSGAANTTSENQSYDSAMVSVTLAELHEMAPELTYAFGP